MSKRDKMITKFFALLDEVEETGNPQAAIQLCQLFIDKKLATPKSIVDNELRFYTHSKKKVKCDRCQVYYMAGDPCFAMNGKGWHEKCATEEEKKFPYYLKCKSNEKKLEAPPKQTTVFPFKKISMDDDEIN
jgi:hypothetical protein